LERAPPQGWGRKVAISAIDDFKQGMVRAGVTSFYLEAVVGIDNVASQRIAACGISPSPKDITDNVSGLPALHYSMHVGN
jgi:hypothetical protein